MGDNEHIHWLSERKAGVGMKDMSEEQEITGCDRQKSGRPRRTRITKEPEERKREIIETALKLFAEKGYENTTIQDIAERMDVSQGLCYRYFKSKSEIFAASAEYYAQQAVEQIKIPISDDVSPLEKFNLIIKRIFEYTIKHHEFEANYKQDEEIRASRLDNVAENMVSVLIPIVQQCVNEGVFHCTNVEFTTRLFTFGIIHTIHSAMPKENTKQYFLSYLDFLKNMFVKSLEVQTPDMLGTGWDELY